MAFDPAAYLAAKKADDDEDPGAPTFLYKTGKGQEAGNIDLTNRPRVKNADGSVSTIRSLGVNVDGKETLIPTVSEDGRIMSDDEAVQQYRSTGRHLGKFSSIAASNAAAKSLHEEQARMGNRWGRQPGEAAPGVFDPAAYLASKQAEDAPPVEDRIGRGNRQFAVNSPTVEGPNGPSLAPAIPMLPTSVTGAVAQMGRTVAGGAKAVGNIAVEEAKSLPGAAMRSMAGPVGETDYLGTHPEARRELERGVSDAVTAGLAEKAARYVDPEHFSLEAAAKDAEAAPGARVGGGLVGSFLPSPARALAGKVGSSIGGTGAQAGVIRNVAQYEAVAPASAAVQAEGGIGERADAALHAAIDPGALLLAGGTGAAAGVAPKAAALLSKKAQDRMVDQAIKDIAGSRATAVSTRTDRRIMRNAIEPIREELREPDAIKIADTARKDPGQAWEMVQKKVNSITQDRKASYQAVDAETGGFRISDLRRHLADEVKRLGEEPGQATERQAVEAMISDIEKTWGGKAAPSLPTLKLREYVTRLQRVAADTMGGLEETRRVQILDHVSGLAKDFLDKHLDDAAASDPALKPVVDGLRDQNRRVSAWLSLEDALKTRAGKLATDNMIDNKAKTFLGGVTAAGIAHTLHSPLTTGLAAAGAVAPYVIPPLDRAVTRGVAGISPPQSLNAATLSRLIEASRARQASERDYTQP